MAENTVHVNVKVDVQNIEDVKEILEFAHAAAEKFIAKVESGRARSTETFNDMKTLKGKIEALAEKMDS